MANENVKIDAIDSPKAVVEEVGVEGGKESGWDMPEGSFIYQTADVTVIVNGAGKVITVIPREGD